MIICHWYVNSTNHCDVILLHVRQSSELGVHSLRSRFFRYRPVKLDRTVEILVPDRLDAMAIRATLARTDNQHEWQSPGFQM